MKRFGPRIIYDAASSCFSKLNEYIEEGRWAFPVPTSMDLSRIVSRLPPLSLSDTDLVNGCLVRMENLPLYLVRMLSEGWG